MKKRIFTKRIFTMMIITLMVMSIIPSYADNTEQSSADLLLKYDFITGVGGDPLVSKPLTRAEVAVIMAALSGNKEEASQFSKASTFTDVASDKWYNSYISYGKEKGYLGGYPDGSFRPDSLITDREFAAFLMNALGYNGDYEYNEVCDFAKSKNILVETEGANFVRGDAFKAMWAAVNQPKKGSNISLGVALGKLESNTEEAIVSNAVENVEPNPISSSESNLDFRVKANSLLAFEVRFDNPVVNTSKLNFEVKNKTTNMDFTTIWGPQKTLALLDIRSELSVGEYEITVIDNRLEGSSKKHTIKVNVEKERIVDVGYGNCELVKYDEHTATVKYNILNQYNSGFVNKNLDRELVFSSSTPGVTIEPDFDTDTLIIHYGSASDPSKKIDDLSSVTIDVTDTELTLKKSVVLNVNVVNNHIIEIKIGGIVDENGNAVELVYDTTKAYYVDVYAVNTQGEATRTTSALDSYDNGGPISVQVSENYMMAVYHINHPFHPDETSFKIVFLDEPLANTTVTFVAHAASQSIKDSNSFVTTLIAK